MGFEKKTKQEASPQKKSAQHTSGIKELIAQMTFIIKLLKFGSLPSFLPQVGCIPSTQHGGFNQFNLVHCNNPQPAQPSPVPWSKSPVHPLIHDVHSNENHQGSVAPPKPIQASEPPATTAKLVFVLRGQARWYGTKRPKANDVILDLEIHNITVNVMFC